MRPESDDGDEQNSGRNAGEGDSSFGDYGHEQEEFSSQPGSEAEEPYYEKGAAIITKRRTTGMETVLKKTDSAERLKLNPRSYKRRGGRGRL